MTFLPPPKDCPLCPRLVQFRAENCQKFPLFYNGAVPSFGDMGASMLVVGLAPGLKGANATGRPFTGDYAGIILYNALLKAGLAQGDYRERPDDGLELVGVRISNAVRCVPPQNTPTPEEARTCNKFLVSEIAAMPNLRVILCLGQTSHQAVVRTLGLKQKDYKFGHGTVHKTEKSLLILDSYHTSRYNINTGCLTVSMFDAIIGQALTLMG